MLPWIAATVAIAALALTAVIVSARDHRRRRPRPLRRRTIAFDPIEAIVSAAPPPTRPRPRSTPRLQVPAAEPGRLDRGPTVPLFSGAVIASLIPTTHAPLQPSMTTRGRSRIYFVAR